MYYHYPELDAAYAMDGNGNSVQYMFGPYVLFSPVVAPGDTTQVPLSSLRFVGFVCLSV